MLRKGSFILIILVIFTFSLVAIESINLRDIVEINPDSFDLTILQGESINRDFTITNISTGTVTYNIDVNYDSGSSWIDLSNMAGSILPNSTKGIAMQISGASLSEGTYGANIEVTANSETISIPLNLVIVDEAIITNPTIISYETTTNSQINGEFTIENITSGTFTYTININYPDNLEWFDIDNYEGYLDNFETETIDYEINTTNIPYGNYECSIDLSYLGNEISIPVELIVASANSDDDLIIYKNELLANYPNPFNPTTTINYSIANESNVSIDIYNSKGQLIKTLVNEFLEAGVHSTVWNGTDNNGKIVSSGIYFTKLSIGNEIKTQKMIMQK